MLYRKYPYAVLPLGFAVAFNVAEYAVMLVAACVTTVGPAGVVKEKIEPNPVPSLFVAIAQKKYVVPADNPVMYS